MKNILKKAHELTKEIKKEYPQIDYKFQLGICIKYLYNKGEKMINLKQILTDVKKGDRIYIDVKKDSAIARYFDIFRKGTEYNEIELIVKNNNVGYLARDKYKTSKFKWFKKNTIDKDRENMTDKEFRQWYWELKECNTLEVKFFAYDDRLIGSEVNYNDILSIEKGLSTKYDKWVQKAIDYMNKTGEEDFGSIIARYKAFNNLNENEWDMVYDILASN